MLSPSPHWHCSLPENDHFLLLGRPRLWSSCYSSLSYSQTSESPSDSQTYCLSPALLPSLHYMNNFSCCGFSRFFDVSSGGGGLRHLPMLIITIKHSLSSIPKLAEAHCALPGTHLSSSPNPHPPMLFNIPVPTH